MRLAISGTTGEEFELAHQVGATDAVGGGTLPADKGFYTLEDLTRLRERVEKAGLRLSVISGLPEELTFKIKLGLPGREEQTDNWCRTIRNVGEAGIPNLIYFFSLRSWYGNYGLRTDRAAPGKGGSELTSFDYDAVKRETGEYWYPPVPLVAQTAQPFQQWPVAGRLPGG